MYILTESGRKKTTEYLKSVNVKRKLCIEKALDTVINTPEWTLDTVKEYLDEGYIFGDRTGQIFLNIRIADDTRNPEYIVLVYGEDFTISETEESFLNNKKLNAAYWDEIDNIVMCFLRDIRRFSTSPIGENEVDDATALIRDSVVKELERRGGTFPYIDCNM